MKKIIIVMFLFCFAVLFSSQALAQSDFKYQPEKKIEVSKDVKIGKLPNGLTYYIRKNALPAKRAELYLVVNAGAMQETDAQQGLAHFLEHMAFNGTKKYPKNELVKTLESMGVRFGSDLNAYTSFDETVYQLPIPTDKISDGFNVLEEWAFNLNLTGKDIDDERGVILEEMRLGKGASDRLRKKTFPVMLYGTMYPDRFPIGKEDILKNFKHQEIRSFYKDWYRPNNMAVIAVGDFDPAVVEKEIISRFSKGKNPDKAPERKVAPFVGHEQPKAVVATDKEMPSTQVQYVIKNPARKVETQKDYVDFLIKDQLLLNMISARLAEEAQKPDAKFLYAMVTSMNYVRPFNMTLAFAITPPSGAKDGYKALLTEIERAGRFGFNQSELDRAKASVLSTYESSYNDRDKTLSENFVGELQRNFLTSEVIPGIEFEYNLVKEALPTINLEDINQMSKLLLKNENRSIIVLGPEGENISYPTEQELIQTTDEVEKLELTAYQDNLTVDKLMEKAPEKGSVVQQKYYKNTGVTEWILSNGAKVVLKPTDFKNDEILFDALSKGGRSLVDPNDDYSAVFATSIAQESGLNGIKASDLHKLMAGKNIEIRPQIMSYSEGMTGNFVPKDTKEAFEIINLYFTAPYFSKDAFDVFIKNAKSQYEKYLDNPNAYFGYNISEVLANNNPRNIVIAKPSDFDKVNLEKAEAVYKQRFADASDFTFIFVGNFTLDNIKPFVETYIASLPSKNSAEKAIDMKLTNYPAPSVEKVFYKGIEDKSAVRMLFKTPLTYSEKLDWDYKGFNDILSMRMLMALREEMSGVYGVGAIGSIKRDFNQEGNMMVVFGSNTESYDELYKRAIVEIEKLQKEGPKQEEVDALKAKSSLKLEKDLKQNRYWLSELSQSYYYGESPENILKAQNYINSYKAKDIQNAGKKAINTKDFWRFILLPEKK